jgi:hypothetical protein
MAHSGEGVGFLSEYADQTGMMVNASDVKRSAYVSGTFFLSLTLYVACSTGIQRSSDHHQDVL